MKILIPSPVLRKYFKTAWNCVPTPIQDQLKPFLRQVRQVNQLEGTRIFARGDAPQGPLSPGGGYTYCYQSNTRFFADIILPVSLLEVADDWGCVALILHELGHAYDFFTQPEVSRTREQVDTEAIAWEFAFTWTFSSDLSEETKFEMGAEIAYLKLRLFV